MEVDNEWNGMSEEDTIIMSLMGIVQANSKKSKSKKAKTTSNSSSGEATNDLNENPSQKSKKPYIISDWKKQSPASNNSKTKLVDNRTYNWCKKCRDGEGMWALHQEQAHIDGFKRNQSKNANAGQDKKTKAVSFNVENDNDADSSDDDGPKLQVKGELLADAKAFLSQFTDFPKGGV